ncbi:sensor domain-containing protein [Mycobacterium sp. G7A2]|uniref:sensor domain-containing protein n=1 Tax=Mycobacterium sp. G7A2 TaxID=3317307 RepID=UPI0035A84CFE
MLAAAGSVVLVAACARHVDDATATAGSVAAPILTTQVADLLSPDVRGEEGNLFAVVEPQRCAGLAREVDPPFIQAHRPLATDGGHWTTPDGSIYIEEMVAVYRYDFDPAAALDLVRRTADECRDQTLTVTTMKDRTYLFDVAPGSAPQPQNSVLWQLRAVDWNCDNTFVAAHNAAVEITACGESGNPGAADLAEEALARIEALANTAA